MNGVHDEENSIPHNSDAVSGPTRTDIHEVERPYTRQGVERQSVLIRDPTNLTHTVVQEDASE